MGEGREEGEGRYAVYDKEKYIYKYTHSEPEVNIRRNCTGAPFFTLTYCTHFLTNIFFLDVVEMRCMDLDTFSS